MAAETTTDRPRVIAPPPVIFVTAFLVGWALETVLPGGTVSRAARTAGLALLVAGLLLAGSFIRAFVRAGTPVEPYKPASALVTAGPYRFSRNPGYVGMALAYAGVALLTSTPWALLTLVPALVVIDRRVVVPEERYLERAFGDDYRAYRGRVRRWL